MKKNLATLAVCFSTVLWGLLSLFVTQFVEWGIPPISVSCIRMVFSSILIIPCLLIIKPNALKIKLKHLPLFALVGIAGMFGASTLYSVCVTMTSASVATILMYTSPIFIFIYSIFFLKEKITVWKVLAIFLAVFGCVLVSNVLSGGVFSLEGIIIGLLSGLAYALYSIIGSIVLRFYSPITVTAYAFIFASLISFVMFDYGAIGVAFTNNGFAFIGLAFLFGIVTGIAPYGLYTIGLSGMEATKAGILACIEPVVATLVGIFFLNQLPELLQYIGIVLIIAAIIILQVSSKPKKNA